MLYYPPNANCVSLNFEKKKKLEFMIFCGPYFIVKNNSDVVLFIDNPVATCRIRYVAR